MAKLQVRLLPGRTAPLHRTSGDEVLKFEPGETYELDDAKCRDCMLDFGRNLFICDDDGRILRKETQELFEEIEEHRKKLLKPQPKKKATRAAAKKEEAKKE